MHNNTDRPSRAELPDSRTLLKSTAIATLIAALILVTAILPAEYGIDPTGAGRVLGLTQMGEIKLGLAREAQSQAAKSVPTQTAPQPPQVADKPAAAEASTIPKPQARRDDTLSVKLKPGQAAEVKLAMRKGATVGYEWTVTGGAVNYDTHGDPVNRPKNSYHGYGKGLNKSGDSGTLQAAFDGTHGWYWRNRGGAEVTVTLKVSGEHTAIDRVL